MIIWPLYEFEDYHDATNSDLTPSDIAYYDPEEFINNDNANAVAKTIKIRS
jgi:hypothetical protein